MFFQLLDECAEFSDKGVEPMPSLGEFLRWKVQQHAAEKWKDVAPRTRSLLLSFITSLFKGECCVNGSHSIYEVGLQAFGLYKSLPGLDCTFPGGYEGIVENLLSELPADLVTYNRPVRCVHWSSSGQSQSPVIVECENGEKIPADHVIVTVPLGYLKQHQSTLFQPPLPLHKSQSIQRMGFGTNNKIFVEFDSPWWDEDCDVIYLVWEGEEDLSDQVPDLQRSWIKKMFGFTVLKPIERYGYTLCGWVAGHESEYMETLSEQEVTQAVTELVRRFSGNPIITPRRILRSQWFHDPWTRGSYSFPRTGCSKQDLENLQEPLPVKGSQSRPLQVLFAGEATHSHHYSTVHGALLSGQREADRLISHYGAVSQPHVDVSKL